MHCKKVSLRITLQKMAHFAFSMQNSMNYFRWTAGIIVVTNSFLTGTKREKYGSRHEHYFGKNESRTMLGYIKG